MSQGESGRPLSGRYPQAKARVGVDSSPLLSKLQSTHQHLQPTSSTANPGSTPSLNTVGSTSKIRVLEDYIDRFDVDRPHKDSQTIRFETAFNSTQEGKHHRSAAEREMRRIEKENLSRRVRNNDAKAAFENKQKDKIDKWVQLAEKNNRKLAKENDVLSRIAQLTQENCINNDARYEETLNSLRAELEYTTLFRQDSADTLHYVRQAIGTIQERITHMRKTGERQAQADHVKLKQELEELLVQQTRELEEVRESGSNTTGEWVSKNKTLQSQVETLLYQTDAEYTTNQELLARHKQLQVEHNAQADDSAVLEKQFHTTSHHHQELRNRIHDLELELASANGATSATAEMDGNSPNGALAQMVEAQRGLQKSAIESEQSVAYASALRKAQALLQQEADNLGQVRAAHVKALRQRTELEVFFRQALLHYVRRNQDRLTDAPSVLQGENHGAGNGISALANFTVQDRRQLIEGLLVKERVLQLLYNEEPTTDRPDASSSFSSKTLGSRNFDSKLGSEDIEDLWLKWKQWTMSAEQALKE